METSVSVSSIINEVYALYGELPSPACRCCGWCCVSPACTPIEFLTLLDYCRHNLNSRDIRLFLTHIPQFHPTHPGHLRCPFAAENRCAVYPGRTGSCRVFAIPATNELGIANVEQCRYSIPLRDKECDARFLHQWLSRLTTLNTRYIPLTTVPFFLTGLNLSCWLDVCFDDSLDMDVFGEIRRMVEPLLQWYMQHIPDSGYKPKTGLKEKVDKIAILSTLIDGGNPDILRPLLHSIRNDYPLTGTFFTAEADAMLRCLDG